jgi:hypothetical protein
VFGVGLVPMHGVGLVPMHGIGSRHDLPLPFPFVVVGAAVALVVSFVVLFLAWRRPRYAQPDGKPLLRLTRLVDHPAFRWSLQLIILGLYGWAAMALFFGKDLLTNPVFGFVYVWMWVGLVPLSLLFGPFWRATNPLRSLHRGLCVIARTDPRVGLAKLPAGVGIWPAAVALFGFGWLELVQPDRATLTVLRVWALAWIVVLVLGAVVFGERWIGAADPFETYSCVVAQLSPLRRVGAKLRLVNPLAGLNQWRPPPGAAAVVSVLLGNTAFDSFANTSWWIQTAQSSSVPIFWATGGLLGMSVLVLVTFSLAATAMAPFSSDRSRRFFDYPRLMAGSVVPIAIGYAVAHYATLLIVEGQRTAINMSDPLGRGWNVFGSAEMGVNSAVFDHPTGVACVQLGAILTGHIVGIVAAHEKALSVLRPTAALAGQWQMLVLMVCYTCSGLILLFSP